VGLAGYDQGVHNYLMHAGVLKNVARYKNWAGPVLTLGAVSSDDLSVPEDGILRNLDGEIINVIHQYDRRPAVGARILERLEKMEAAA
jgi:hypothetical protein